MPRPRPVLPRFSPLGLGRCCHGWVRPVMRTRGKTHPLGWVRKVDCVCVCDVECTLAVLDCGLWRRWSRWVRFGSPADISSKRCLLVEATAAAAAAIAQHGDRGNQPCVRHCVVHRRPIVDEGFPGQASRNGGRASHHVAAKVHSCGLQGIFNRRRAFERVCESGT